jgi:hypothetical protein
LVAHLPSLGGPAAEGRAPTFRPQGNPGARTRAPSREKVRPTVLASLNLPA